MQATLPPFSLRSVLHLSQGDCHSVSSQVPVQYSKDLKLCLIRGVILWHAFSQGTPSGPCSSMLYHTYLSFSPDVSVLGLHWYPDCFFPVFSSIWVSHSYSRYTCTLIHLYLYFVKMSTLATLVLCTSYKYLRWLLLWYFQFVIYTKGEGLTHSANNSRTVTHQILNVLQFGVMSSLHDLFHPTGLCSQGLGFRVCMDSALCCSRCTCTSLNVYCPTNLSCLFRLCYNWNVVVQTVHNVFMFLLVLA